MLLFLIPTSCFEQRKRKQKEDKERGNGLSQTKYEYYIKNFENMFILSQKLPRPIYFIERLQ